MSEKTKNQAAVLTVATLFTIAIIYFPVIAICYLAFLWLIAISSKEFHVLALAASPIVATYFVFLSLIEHKAVVKYIKARYKEVEHLLF